MKPGQVPDPFSVLGLRPTQDLQEVKRAYFRALAAHPPHKDPEGFRRLRQAYDAVSQPGALAAAYLRSPLDLEAELARLAPRCAAVEEQASQAGQREEPPARDRFLQAVWGLRYQEATALLDS